MDDSARQSILDGEYLRLLRIGYFIQGGTTALMSLFGLLYVFMGIFFFSSLANMPNTSEVPPPQFVGYLFALFGGLFTVGAGTVAALQFLTASSLRRRRWRTLCMITAALTCFLIPYGTALGICTFMVLSRPGVRTLFHGGSTESGSTALPQSAPPSSVA